MFYAGSDENEAYRPFALNALTLREDRVRAVTAFIARSAEPLEREVFEHYPDESLDAAKVDNVFSRFGLPTHLMA